MYISDQHIKNLHKQPIQVAIDDPKYPERVKKIMGVKAPEFLYMMGNLNLLNTPGIGFCGSRKSSQKGLETAKDCAEKAAKGDVSIISGNAAGVDVEVHFRSLKAGGKTILVLAEGIKHFYIRKSLKSVWDWDRVLVISQFKPDDSWQSFRAMTRNQLIIALSRVMIVIEAKERGGTISAGKETLRFGLPLFVALYEDMLTEAKGNKLLLDMGAQKLTKNKNTNEANLKKVFDILQTDTLINNGVQQANLF